MSKQEDTLDWNDVKIFLALARQRTVRAAATAVATSHSTVARRIAALEKRLGVRLFDRTSQGLVITRSGQDVLALAESAQSSLIGIERRLQGRDQRLTGHVRVATVDFLATHFLIPLLPEFSRIYPQIDIEILTSYRALDLNRNEAEIALRITGSPSPNLVGRQLAIVAFAPYGSHDYLQQHDLNADGASWIGYGARDRAWVNQTPFAHLPIRGVLESLLSQYFAARSGLGLAMLPCLMGDADAQLRRVAPAQRHAGRGMWVLTHRDVRTTARVRALVQFITRQAVLHKARIEGLPTRDA